MKEPIRARGPVQQAPAEETPDYAMESETDVFADFLSEYHLSARQHLEICVEINRIVAELKKNHAALIAQEREKWEREREKLISVIDEKIANARVTAATLARGDVLKKLREHLIKSSESGVSPCGWEPTDPNRACENDTCAVCIFDKAVESLRSEVGK